MAMKKSILIHNKTQLDNCLSHNVTSFIFGDDQFNALGYGQIDSTTFETMINTCNLVNADVYVLANQPIHQHQLDEFKNHLIKCSNFTCVKAVLVSDYSALQFKKELDLKLDLIYAPDTLVTSSLDIQAFLDLGYSGCWIAPELSKTEIEELLTTFKDKLMVQVFGYLKTSNSKRQLLSAYAKHLNKELDIHNCNDLTLIEETRKQKMPIIENNNGTTIFTDFVLYEPEVLPLFNDAAMFIYSHLFIDQDDVLAAYNDQPLPHADNYILDSVYWEKESLIKKG